MLWGSHVFGSWRNTLSIYELNKDITDSVVKSPIPDETPISMFKRLPEWCLYLKYPEKSVKAARLLDTGEIIEAYFDGFWASFDQLYDVKTKTHEQSVVALHLTPNLVDENNNPVGSLQPIVLFMEDGLTVEQAINNAYDFYKDMADDFRDTNKNDDEYNYKMELYKSKDYEIAVGMLSALLWLCAEEPDISNITGEPVSRSELQAPKHTVHPKTKNFITPSMPTVYNIGKRLGGEIRQMNDAIERDKATNKGKGKRPHIRRGHWHGYWRGTGQAKEFFVKWQPAVFVNPK